MGVAMGTMAVRPTVTIVSSFFQSPLRDSDRRVLQIGPLLRPELRQLQPTKGEHIVSYLRKSASPRVLEALAACNRDVIVYGLGERKSEGRLRFREIDEQTFAYDLADCAAVIGAAGNQTLGEALHFGKPILALPEQNHHEQLINAHFLKAMGAGDWTIAESAEPNHLRAFLADIDRFEHHASKYRGQLDGTPQALAEIGRFLPQSRGSRRTTSLTNAA